MPLKGVLLQATVYDPPWSRPITDVDILVPPARYREAFEALQRSGWSCAETNPFESSARLSGYPLAVDLHRLLFPPATFRLTPEDMLHRARQDSSLFECEVWLPNPMDTYAHLIGHFVKSRSGGLDQVHIDDFARIAEKYDFDASICAKHLERCGLARAARYAFYFSKNLGRDTFAEKVLAELGPDPVGEALVTLARFAIPRIPLESRLGAAPAHLLNYSLPSAFSSLFYRVVDSWKEKHRRT
jgi:hypothetical protein